MPDKYIKEIKETYPVKYSEIHSRFKSCLSKMDPLWEVNQERMIERLNPIGVTALQEGIFVETCSHISTSVLHSSPWHMSQPACTLPMTSVHQGTPGLPGHW